MKMEEVVSKKLAPAHGPYCHGRKYGNMILTSGAIPEKEDGTFVFEIKEATKVTLENLLSVVEAAGGTKNSVAKVEVYLKNLDDFDEMNKAYAEFFGSHRPARVCFEVSNLACGVPLEAAMTAFIDE